MDQVQVYQAIRVALCQHLLCTGEHLVTGGHSGHRYVHSPLLTGVRPVVGQVEGSLGLAGARRSLDDRQRRAVQLRCHFDGYFLHGVRIKGKQALERGGLGRRLPPDPAKFPQRLVCLLGGLLDVAFGLYRDLLIGKVFLHRADPVGSGDQAG